MHLSKSDRKQMVEEWLQSLPSPLLLEVSKRLLFDVKNSHDRLNQNPSNSLRPPSSQAPWDKPSSSKQKAATPVETPDPRPSPAAEEVTKHPTAEDDAAAAPDQTPLRPRATPRSVQVGNTGPSRSWPHPEAGGDEVPEEERPTGLGSVTCRSRWPEFLSHYVS